MVSPPHPDETKWVCPVCGAPAGSSGVFVSAWAVACHIAGKTIMGDAEHRVWTKEGPHVVLSKSVPKVAEQIVDRVVVAVRVYNASRLYQILSEIEVGLHRFIRKKLEEEFGPGEEGWWVQSIQLPIRQECAKRREASNRKQEPYTYTDLVDLKQILDSNWGLFQSDQD